MQHEDIWNNEQLVLELKTVSRIKNQYVYILEATNSILFYRKLLIIRFSAYPRMEFKHVFYENLYLLYSIRLVPFFICLSEEIFNFTHLTM